MTPPTSVLHFSTADVIGGSARSAWRIHAGLRAAGLRSRMLVGHRASGDADVDTVWGSRAGWWADRACRRLAAAAARPDAYLPSSHRVARHPWVREADVIQLYNIHGGYFSPWLLPRLARLAPVVWRLSDLWPATGHCAYPGPCERWRIGCGACPDLATYPSLARDTTAALFRAKERLYRQCEIVVVATSRWIEACARASPLLGRFPVVRIANGLDGAAFRPLPQAEARAALGIDAGRRVILFSAHILDDNPRKGSDLLIEALGRLAPDERTLLLLIGEGGRTFRDRAPCETLGLGYRDDAAEIAGAYAAADVVAVPSRVENLPNVLIEAAACGRPAVAFDVGGMADGLAHERTGYLARAGDAADFATGLDRFLADAERRTTAGREARALFEGAFTAEAEIRRFRDLYAGLLAERKVRPGAAAFAAPAAVAGTPTHMVDGGNA